MATIVHSCSSVLVRPNGIVRYINAVMDLQRSLGNEVIFVTDAKPTQYIAADKIYYGSDTSSYTPNWRDGHVWLQVDPKLSTQLKTVYKQAKLTPSLVIAHDLHSYLGLASVVPNGIFIQHESDVLTAGSRYSFLSDEYLAQQIHCANNSTWRIGMTVDSHDITPPRPVYTPAPFTPVVMPFVPKTKGLLYIGDATERKGAREFMQVARALGITPTVITHELDAEVFAGADVHTFGLDQRDEMYQLMAQHKVAFIPSKNECPGLAAIECLQFMPVVVDGQYAWTRYLNDVGAICATGSELIPIIEGLLTTYDIHNTRLLELWSQHSKQLWINLST